MKWKLEKTQTLEYGEVLEFHLKISELDMTKMAPINPLDRLLLKECGKSELCSDKLLALETIVRKIEQS